MTSRVFRSIGIAAVAALSIPGIAGAQGRANGASLPTPQTAAPADGVSLAGKWKLYVVEAQAEMDLELTQTGTEITGVGTSDHLGTMKIEGTFVSGTLTLASTGSVNGQDVRIEYSGKYKENGTLAGELTSQMGAMTWTAERVKK
jgi:hypothetical protein